MIEPLCGLWLADEVNPPRVFHLLKFPPSNPDLSSRDFIVLNEVIMVCDLPDCVLGQKIPYDP
jgi:hypothetical protein